MSLLDDLISYWKLDEASGNAVDWFGTNTLTDNNTVGSVSGKIGNARSFVAANTEFLSSASNASLVCGDIDFTFCGWFRLASLPANLAAYQLVAKDSNATNSRDYTIDFLRDDSFPQNAGVRFYINGGGSNLLVSSGIDGLDTTGEWHFFIAWHNASSNTLNLQVDNGTVVTRTTSGTAPHASSAEFRLGARQFSGFEGYLDGDLDEVGFWKRVLTSDERTELWNDGNGIDIATAGSVTGSLNQSLNSWQISATGQSEVFAELSQSVSWTLAADGFGLGGTGEADLTLSSWSLNSESTVPLQSGSVQVVLDGWSVSSEAFADNTAQSDITLDDWSVAADGVSPVFGSLTQTLEWSLQASAQYGSGFSGALAVTLDSWSAESTSLHNVAGGLSVTLNDWTADGTAIIRSRKPRRLFASDIHANSLFGAR